jgi:hypothetical protein
MTLNLQTWEPWLTRDTHSNAAPSISSVPPALKHGVFNDSSFAAVTTSDGTQRVFFQDIDGNIRQAVYSTSTQSWTAAMTFTIPNTTDARPHTPLSAILYEDTRLAGTSLILLVYVSSNNHLAATLFNHDDSDLWTNTTAYLNVYLNISQYIVAPGSRSLSLVQILNTNGSSDLFLWLENPNGNVTGLHGVFPDNVLPGFTPSINAPFWVWQDITRQIVPISDTQLGTPFIVGSEVYQNLLNVSASATLGIGGFFFDTHAGPNASIIFVAYLNNETGWSSCRSLTISRLSLSHAPLLY